MSMLSSPHPWPDSAVPSGLLPWLIPWPGYGFTTPLQAVVEDLEKALATSTQRPWPSHLILIDEQHRPQGALALGLLWAAQQGTPTTIAEPSLGDYLPWLEPIAILAASTTPAELAHAVPDPSPPCWVMVDGEGQYLGLVDVMAVVAQGLLHPAKLTSTQPATTPLASASVQEQRWVMAMSHALKTPLTSLLGLSTLLLDHRVGPLNDRQSRYAGLMRRAIRKLIRLVNQLVDWMRLEAGQLDLDVVPVDLKALTETLLPTFLTSWLPDVAAPPPWMATFSYRLPAPLPTLCADQLRLQQSLYGVLGYLLHRGATPQSLTLDTWGPWLGLTLRASAATTESLESAPWTPTLGAEIDGMETLGLALARRLCQQQGGDLVGFCSPQDGYSMTLLLPLPPPDGQVRAGHDAEALPRWKSLEAVPTQGGRVVLLVSADAACLVQLQNQLAQGPDRLLLATRWAEAVDLIQRLAPALVLVDVRGTQSMTALPSDPVATLAPFSPSTITKLITETSPEALTVALDPLQPPAIKPLADPTLTLLILTYLGQSVTAGSRAALGTPWQKALQRQGCRLVQADDLPQARLLCRVWQPQAIVLVEGRGLTTEDWDWVAQCPELMQRPWVRLTALTASPPTGLGLRDGSALFTQPSLAGVASLIQMVRAAQG